MPAKSTDEVFDYVIVGAGSAGCTLANRLSEKPGVSICLIEAGGSDRSPLVHVPMGLVGLFRHPRLNWRFQSQAQPKAGGRMIYLPSGKLIGGSSSINGMVYMRGHPGDYDEWSDLGNAGWSYGEVMPYFLRAENNLAWTASPFHGNAGPLCVIDPTSYNPLCDVFIAAAESLQYRRCEDFNAEDMEGFGIRQLTVKNGRRHSAATAYLKPALNRGALTVLKDALVDRVEIVDGRANAVTYVRGAEPSTVRARIEVILCAGTYCSPAILQRSGIGDAQWLTSLGIPVRHHAPGVGQNFQDHAAITAQYRTRSAVPYGISLKSLPGMALHGLNYLFRRRGMLAGNGLEGAGFIKTSPQLTRPDIQFTFISGSQGRIGLGHGYGITAVLLRPKSRGTVLIASSDPHAAPLIDPHFFDDECDLDTLRRGLQAGRRILGSPAFDPLCGWEITPGKAVTEAQELNDYIRNNSATAFHPAGTCQMGRGRHGVVDDKLRVHGVGALRVVDASIMPTVIGGNTNAPAIMIAEKAADMILGKPPLPAFDPRAAPPHRAKAA